MLQKFGVYLLSFNTFEFYFLDLVTLFGGLGLDGFFELLVDFCAFFGFLKLRSKKLGYSSYEHNI